MSRISRRSFVSLMATSAAVLATPYVATGSTRPRVVVIGGGAGGAGGDTGRFRSHGFRGR